MDNVKKIYFSGIAGSGMSALALFSAKQGHLISGSDRMFDIQDNHPFKSKLATMGIPIYPQDGSGITDDLDLVVFSTAVEDTNPEFKKAIELSITIKTRPEYLAELVKKYDTIAIAGTSGKSTTSGMLAFLMNALSMKPNFIGGGMVKQFSNQVNQGNSLSDDSRWLVVEACESDGSIVNYYPHTTVLLNLSLDHHSIEETANMFNRLIANTKSHIIINADDDNLKHLDINEAFTFSLQRPSLCKPNFFICNTLKSRFILDEVEFQLSIPGRHNILNALACISVLSNIGIDKESIASEIYKFQGIQRRFDIHLNDIRGMVIDDYAHNPHKISALMEVTQTLKDSICYVFQPHGYGPTRLMRQGYIDVFTRYLRSEDHLILLPIYYIGGSANKDISSDDIVDAVRLKGLSAEVINERQGVVNMVDEYDAFVVFGARDDSLSELASQIASRLMSK